MRRHPTPQKIFVSSRVPIAFPEVLLRVFSRSLSGCCPAGVLLAVLACLALLLPVSAFADERRIAGPQELAQALQAAQPGDVLRLAPGNYGALQISQSFPGKPLTIRAADPRARPVFTGIFLRNAQGLVLEDLAVLWRVTGSEDAERYRASTAERSRDITLRRILFEGDVARVGRPEVLGYGTAFGLGVRGVQGLTIEDCEFRTWHRALIIGGSRDIVLRGNEFHSLRSDAVDFVAVNRLLVERNYFHDFDRAPGSGDHPDMIQFWTNKSKTPSTDIVIRDNLFNSGHGLFTQSIFMRNEEVDTGRAGYEMYYRNIEITGNIIINAHLNGITVGEADGVRIVSNTLVRNRLSAGPGGSPGLWTPAIRIAEKAENVEIARNVVPKIIAPDKGAVRRPGWRIADNLIIQDTSPARPNYYDKVFAAAISGDPSSLASFAYRPDGPADGKSVGAPGLRADQIAARAGSSGLAILRVSRDSDFINRFHFDASQTLQAGAGSTSPVWDFGDGTRAEGRQVSHDFARPGVYPVTLRTGDGKADRAMARIAVPEPRLVHFDPGRGLIAGDEPLQETRPKGGVLRIGGNAEPIEVPAPKISGLFTRPDFELSLDLAAVGGGTPSGEILRVHEAFILGMAPTGSLTLTLFEQGQKTPRQLRTPPVRLNDGARHRVVIAATARRVEIHVDGSLALRVNLNGPIRQATNRPLVLGGAFGKPGMPAEIHDLVLTAGARSVAR